MRREIGRGVGSRRTSGQGPPGEWIILRVVVNEAVRRSAKLPGVDDHRPEGSIFQDAIIGETNIQGVQIIRKSRV